MLAFFDKIRYDGCTGGIFQCKVPRFWGRLNAEGDLFLDELSFFTSGLFDLFTQPVLLVQSGRFAACNAAARSLGLLPGGAAPAYTPEDGCAAELTLAGKPRQLVVRALGDGQLWVVQPEEADARAAQTLLAISGALQTPLQDLSCAADALMPALEDLEEPALLHAAAVWQRAYYRLLRLNGHLRDFAGGLCEEQTLAPEKTELCAYFDALSEQAGSLCAELGVTLRLKSPARQFYAWIDRQRMAAALCELLSNALKYTPRGGTILLELAHREQTALITLSDHGEGMDGAALAAAFSSYAHFSPLGDGRRGIGFGLPLAQQIVQRHGGNLLLQNSADGVTVHISLPLGAPPHEALCMKSPLRVPDASAPDPALVALSDVLPADVYDPRDL